MASAFLLSYEFRHRSATQVFKYDLIYLGCSLEDFIIIFYATLVHMNDLRRILSVTCQKRIQAALTSNRLEDENFKVVLPEIQSVGEAAQMTIGGRLKCMPLSISSHSFFFSVK